MEPVHFAQLTTSHPQHQGEERGCVGLGHVVVRHEDEEEQPPYPSLEEEEEVTTTAVEESAMPTPANSQMAVATSLVKKAWYSENSELVMPRTK